MSDLPELDGTDLKTPNFSAGESAVRRQRLEHLQGLITMLRIADEVAQHGYLINSSELADLMDINASAVTSRGDEWTWRNWQISRVRREGNQILWHLKRLEGSAG
jgi:ribonuclease HI